MVADLEVRRERLEVRLNVEISSFNFNRLCRSTTLMIGVYNQLKV